MVKTETHTLDVFPTPGNAFRDAGSRSHYIGHNVVRFHAGVGNLHHTTGAITQEKLRRVTSTRYIYP